MLGRTKAHYWGAVLEAPDAPALARQMMMHLDIEVPDLDAAVAGAIEAGATLADFQPQEKVRVMLDPVGHPFCLYVDE
jgi:hypothetical protein